MRLIALLLCMSFLHADIEEKIIDHTQQMGWGLLYYDVLPDFIRKYNIKQVVEVGVAFGGHAEFMLEHSDLPSYIGIDPYLYNYDLRDDFTNTIAKYSEGKPQENFDALFHWVKDVRLAPFAERVQMIRDFSITAAMNFEDNSLDCIFLDGDQTYMGVLQDLTVWYPKLKKGGVLLGDDYWSKPVAKAVQHFFASKHRSFHIHRSRASYPIYYFIK